MSNRVAGILIALVYLILSSYLTFDLPLPGSETSIPITGQTLAICTLSILLPRSYGLTVISLYLLMGGIGLPVFADGASGMHHLVGRTSGYLWSFLLVPLIFGRHTGASWHRGWIRPFTANFLGTLVILSVGTLVLGGMIGLEKAFELGFRPFLLAGLIKSLAGTVLIRLIGSFMRLDWSKKWSRLDNT